jgi:hypothetical protein
MTAPAITRETATVWRAPNGRRYLTRRSAFMATARERMMRDHRRPGEWPDDPCVCSWCRDSLGFIGGGKVWRRYTRVLMRAARSVAR